MKLRSSYISVVRVTDTEELVSHFPMKDGEGSQIYNTQRDVSSQFDLRNRVLTVVCIDETRLQSRSLAVIEFLGPVPTTAGGFTTGWLVGLLVGSMVSCILARSKILKLPGEGSCTLALFLIGSREGLDDDTVLYMF